VEIHKKRTIHDSAYWYNTWSGGSATTFKNIHNSFETTFTALSDTYIFRWYSYIDDANSSGGIYFLVKLIQNIDDVISDFTDPIRVVKHDEYDEHVSVIDIIKTGFNIGDTHTINIRGASSTTNGTMVVRSGGSYLGSRFEVIPIYNATTF